MPAILVREILLRNSPLGTPVLRRVGEMKTNRWLPVLVVRVFLAFSALHELIEWRTTISQGAVAETFFEA